MKPETERWLALANEDIDLAEISWRRTYYSACVAHCQQAIEKVLKAALVERGIRFRKTHDLPELADLLGLDIASEDLDFLAKLTDQYLPSRYGDVHVEYPPEMAENYLESTKRI
jgi:HEPN domain-containing protein